MTAKKRASTPVSVQEMLLSVLQNTNDHRKCKSCGQKKTVVAAVRNGVRYVKCRACGHTSKVGYDLFDAVGWSENVLAKLDSLYVTLSDLPDALTRAIEAAVDEHTSTAEQAEVQNGLAFDGTLIRREIAETRTNLAGGLKYFGDGIVQRLDQQTETLREILVAIGRHGEYIGDRAQDTVLKMNAASIDLVNIRDTIARPPASKDWPVKRGYFRRLWSAILGRS